MSEHNTSVDLDREIVSGGMILIETMGKSAALFQPAIATSLSPWTMKASCVIQTARVVQCNRAVSFELVIARPSRSCPAAVQCTKPHAAGGAAVYCPDGHRADRTNINAHAHRIFQVRVRDDAN